MPYTQKQNSNVARFRHGSRRKRYNFSLDPDTYEKVADAAYATRRSLSAFVELAILEYIKSEEAKNGPFPKRPEEAEETE